MSQVNQYKSGRCAEWFCLSLNIYIIYIYYILSPMSYFYDIEKPKQENTVAEPGRSGAQEIWQQCWQK